MNPKIVWAYVSRKVTPLEAAAKELVEAEHARLVAQTGSEYAASQVLYHTRRIDRLRQYISNTATAGETK